jgi:hypothetical protein
MTTPNPYEPPKAVVIDPSGPTAHVVSVIPYVLAFLACALVYRLATSAIHRLYGFGFHWSIAIMAVVVSVCIAADLFGRRHRRMLFPSERVRFIFGCFLVFWFFETGLEILARSLTDADTTARQFIVYVVSTVVEFLLTAFAVLLFEPLMIRRNDAARVRCSADQ